MTDVAANEPAGALAGAMRSLLRLEGLGLAVAAVALYAQLGTSWWLFAALILAPDLGLLGYLSGPRLGAATYNMLHVTAAPLTLGLLGIFSGTSPAIAIALIWLAHIGIDRAFGYGLKYAAGFGFTHLGRVGRG